MEWSDKDSDTVTPCGCGGGPREPSMGPSSQWWLHYGVAGNVWWGWGRWWGLGLLLVLLVVVVVILVAPKLAY